ncbi:MAG: polymer-forming cytoskeletal protein [Hyphomicrobiales bacterium]
MSESVLADDLHIKGEVITNGDVELKGTVDGEIRCRTLLVAEDARVMGTASAEKVVIRGAVEGTISGNRVTLTSSAKVRGEVLCKALSVDEEAYFDGRSQRVDDPMQDTRKRIDEVAREAEARPSVSSGSQAPAAQPQPAPQQAGQQPAQAAGSAKGGSAPKSEKNGGGPAQPIASGASH